MQSRNVIGTLAGAIALLAIATPARAQHQGHDAAAGGAHHVALSDGWHARLDRPGNAGPEFTTMPPGWHVTSGPSGIVYHPERTASGNYRVESRIHLFDPGERREAFGVFIGGQDLDGDGQRYTYFLLRRDGRFLIKTRAGAETAVLAEWTAHAAVHGWDSRAEGAASVENDLAIDVGADEVAFLVNGQEVARVPRAQVDTDGIVGLRVNHGLNLHVASLEVTPK